MNLTREDRTMAVLEVQGIHKRFRSHEVLKGVDLEIGPGEIVGITGENGSGKTTLVSIIVGLLKSNKGQVKIHGGFGYCSQVPLVFEDLTMRANISYFSAAYGLEPDVGMARGEALMEKLNCSKYADMLASHMSGGTVQKLNLIISLLNDPDLLILDEPYQGFDYESYLSFWDLAAELKEDGRSVLLVSPMVHEQDKLSTIYHLKDGRLVGD
jgi:ABC-type multidrug transport system ATPase subunit